MNTTRTIPDIEELEVSRMKTESKHIDHNCKAKE